MFAIPSNRKFREFRLTGVKRVDGLSTADTAEDAQATEKEGLDGIKNLQVWNEVVGHKEEFDRRCELPECDERALGVGVRPGAVHRQPFNTRKVPNPVTPSRICRGHTTNLQGVSVVPRGVRRIQECLRLRFGVT